MSPFDRSRTPRICDDPLFGRLEYKRGVWIGMIRFGPTATDVGVTVRSGESVPGEEMRSTFRELERRYDALAPAIAKELWALYEPYFAANAVSELTQVHPLSPDQIWGMTEIDWIEVDRGDELNLGFGFRDSVGWGDAMFVVRLTGWQPVAQSLSD